MYQRPMALTLSVLLSYATIIAAQSAVPRCFQYTWLGPRWNNESTFLNATCQDATRLASGVPCQLPLVVSYDGTWPDVNYIWKHHSQNASCILASNDVCATYTYYFDGQVENSTSMCTRAVNDLGQAINSGCYTQINGSYVTRVCFCRSIAGAIPCNNAQKSLISLLAVIFAFALVITKNFNL